MRAVLEAAARNVPYLMSWVQVTGVLQKDKEFGVEFVGRWVTIGQLVLSYTGSGGALVLRSILSWYIDNKVAK